MPKKPSSTDATSTVTTSSLASQLARDYPQLYFAVGPDCAWQPEHRRVTYRPDAPPAELLHELGHALLDHTSYERDVELLGIERAAWDYATAHLAARYGVVISEEAVELALDSYREWLHQRSRCPSCGLNGVQTAARAYHCLGCQTDWRVNEARSCGLRRYTAS